MLYWIASSVFLVVGFVLLAFECARQARTESTSLYRNPAVTSKFLGLVCGLLIGLAFAIPQLSAFFSVMTIGFLFLAPFAVGVVSIYSRPRADDLRWHDVVFGPWLPSLLTLTIAGILGFEGANCLVMALPIWLLLASLGGGAGALLRSQSGAPAGAFATFLVFTPFISAGWEYHLPNPENEIITLSEIEIQAHSARVWEEIASVREIQASEKEFSLAEFMGFPSPIAATLWGIGPGSSRKATFTGGIEFTETITEWKTNAVIAFDIKPNTDKIPQTTLDPHVTIGGEFFDVLSGRYEILLSEPGKVRLRLYSRHRLSTRFNWYAEIWATAIMRSIQEQILHVVKKRAEVPIAISE